MDRLACIDLPAFPLQLRLKGHPDRRRLPTVVVDRDSPQGVVLWANEHARHSRILPGIRYATALSIAPTLQAGTVSRSEIDAGIKTVNGILYEFSPEIEASKERPGTFWLNASGLGYLHPSFHRWAVTIRSQLARKGLYANIAIGFSRFGTYASTRRGHPLIIFDDTQSEHVAVRTVMLDRLDFDPQIRDTLTRLGITTIGDFLRLPAAGLRDRFGYEAYRLYKLAAGEGWTPLQADPPETPLVEHTALDHALTDAPNLLFLVKTLLERLLKQLAARSRALAEMTLGLTLERTPGADAHARHDEHLRPAEPTLDLRTLIELVRLRLNTLELPCGVIEVRVQARATSATPEQIELFKKHPRRDLHSAERALARLRAEFGQTSVVTARLRTRHLPEASFEWQPISRLCHAEPRNVRRPVLIRRIRQKPLPLPQQSETVRNNGPVVRSLGPYIVSGGWWTCSVHREYHYVETETGNLLWIYFDRRRRRWFLHGTVE